MQVACQMCLATYSCPGYTFTDLERFTCLSFAYTDTKYLCCFEYTTFIVADRMWHKILVLFWVQHIYSCWQDVFVVGWWICILSSSLDILIVATLSVKWQLCICILVLVQIQAAFDRLLPDISDIAYETAPLRRVNYRSFKIKFGNLHNIQLITK